MKRSLSVAMLPLLSIGLRASPSPELPLRRVSVVIGSTGAQPSIVGQAAITTKDQFDAAVARAKDEASASTGEFIAALVQSVQNHTFRALVIYKKQGDLRLYGSTIDAHTLEVLYSKPIVEGVDFKYTWHGVRSLGSMWFKFKKPSETSHTAAAAIDTTTGKSFGVSLNAFVQDTGKLRNVVRLA